MTLCQTLFGQEQEWRKHSVYPLRDDSDRDFEFYVLVDPGKDEQRPLFLKVLEQAIAGPSAKLEGDALSQFKEWTGTDDGSIATAINWIKIAIERYPMRLFVVRDKIPNDTLHPFLKKRICWIERSEFEEQLKKFHNAGQAAEQFKLWLHAQWVKHLIKDVREDLRLEARAIFFAFISFTHSLDTSYLPDTLPGCLRTTAVSNGHGDLARFDLSSLSIDCDSLSTGWTPEEGKDAVRLAFSRHGHWFRFENNQVKCDLGLELSPHYFESFTGALSYAGRLLDAYSDLEKHHHFLLLLAETALLRIGIADERFQEWWENHETQTVMDLFQQRIVATFWEKPKEFGQREAPSHKFYASYEPSQGKLECTVPPVQGALTFDALWPQGERSSLDILVLHQGILDKWRSDASKQDFTQELLKWKEAFPFVVITSGRGRPDAVPNGVKFLPFAGVEACMMGTYFEKLTLLRQIAAIIETGGVR